MDIGRPPPQQQLPSQSKPQPQPPRNNSDTLTHDFGVNSPVESAFSTGSYSSSKDTSPTTISSERQSYSTDVSVADITSPSNSLKSGGTTESRASSQQQTVSAACLNCRGKHLKCDGQTPCARCVSSSSECVYVASRRGYKGPRRVVSTANPNKRQASSSPGVDPGTCPMMGGRGGGGVGIDTGARGVNGVRGSSVMGRPMMTAATTGAAMMTYTPAMALSAEANLQPFRSPFVVAKLDYRQQSIEERCVDSFFRNFHQAHPFVLPREHFDRITRDGTLGHLVAAVRFIGALYLNDPAAKSNFFEEGIRLAYQPTCPKDGFLVQALLLMLLGLDGSCQQERARQLLADVERISIEISLNTRQFAALHGRGNPVLEESWRRTWWELFVVDGMIAGVHRMTNFLLFDIVADVELPCEEKQYLTGTIPPPMTLQDFDDQLFSADDRQFSSFAYRIAAARNLGTFMRVPPIASPCDENMTRIENMLTNWRMHLPPSKRESLDKNCQFDEMMFQAHFMTHATTLLLHQPHSQLDSSPANAVNSCAPHPIVACGDLFNTHTRHTITAACELSQMDEEDLRQQIRLNIGALNKLSEVWQSAVTASGQVKSVAQEIYKAKKAQQISPTFWIGLSQEDAINNIAADENIMDEFTALLTG